MGTKLTRFHTKKNHFQEHNDKYGMTLTYVINKRDREKNL